MMMAGAIAPPGGPALCCCSHKTLAFSLSSSPHMTLAPRSTKSHAFRPIPRLRLVLDSPWSGLKLVGVLPRQNYYRREKKGRCRGRVVYASLFGVGAPEVLVIGVVALLVFGPKGLAEVARNLGKTLRAFQPTIRELQEVSREFKSTLEQEIGLNEVTSSMNNTYRPTSFPNENQQAVVDPNGTTTKPYTSEELLKATEEQLATSAVRPQIEASNPEEQPQVSPTTTEVTAATTPEVKTPAASPDAAARTQSPAKAENER